VTILNPIRAVMGIHNHRFNLFGNAYSGKKQISLYSQKRHKLIKLR
jgi:hypothetical protein